MMTGKDLLVIMIAINLVFIVFAFSCGNSQSGICPNIQGSMVGTLFNIDGNSNLYSSTGLSVSSIFNNAIGSITSAQSGTQSSSDEGISFAVILDGLKMVLSVLIIFTPIPILDMLASTGVPLLFTMFIGVPLVVVYVINMVELIRGAVFGS